MKLFVFSDVHGFADELINGLDKAGFESGNPEHLLIGCGDYLDRGSQPFKTINYLSSIPNKVLIFGNHEELILDCIKRKMPLSHDWHNGTAQTIIDLADYYSGDPSLVKTFEEACKIVEKQIKKFIKQMVNYYNTEHYIFVHSWIPLNREDDLPKYYTKNRKFSKMENWREASKQQWEEARWCNPFDMIKQGLMPDNQTIAFGHWHVSAAWAIAENRSEFGEDAKFDPFYGDGWISLDACTAHSKKVNIVVLEDNLLN